MTIQSFSEELKRFKSERMFVIVLFIIPILTVVLLGNAFSSEIIDDIPMAVIDYDNSNFSRQLIKAFGDNKTFDIVAYPHSEKALAALMEDSKVRVAMVIPRGFYNDVQTLKSPTILMVYDGSHMSITSVAKSKAMEILLTYKAGATITHLQSRLNLSYDDALNITQAFRFSNRMIYNPTKSFRDFLTPVFMVGVVQSAIVLMATVSIDHEIFKKQKSLRHGYALGKVLFYGIMGCFSIMICIFIQKFIFDVTFVGSILDAFALSLAYTLAVSSFAVLISALIKNRMVALIGGGVIFIPNSIMAGTTWPLYAMPIGYQGAVKMIPFIHYVVNLRDIYLKGAPLHQMHKDLIFLLTFAIIGVIVTESILSIAAVEQEDKKESEITNDISTEFQEGIQVYI